MHFLSRLVSGVAAVAVLAWPALMRAQDVTPPAGSMTPSGGTYQVVSISVTIDWTDSQSRLDAASRYVTLNGVDVTSSFTYTSISLKQGRLQGTIALNPGNNTLFAQMPDVYGNVGQYQATFTRVVAPSFSVTPDGDTTTAAALESNQKTFSVQNTTTSSKTYTLSVSCTGVTGCSAPSQVTVAGGSTAFATVTYTGGTGGSTGRVSLLASDGTASDSGWVAVSSQWVNHLSAGPSFGNPDAQNVSRCASACFDAVYAQSTVPYVSMGAPRAVTLVYHGARVSPKTFVYADVAMSGAPVQPTELKMQVVENGAPRAFTNGENTLHFVGTRSAVRLVGQLATQTDTTVVHQALLVVKATYTDGHGDSTSVPLRYTTVNEALSSTVAAGWSIGGLQRVRVQADSSVLVTDGTGSALVYSRASCDASGCSFNRPTGEYANLARTAGGQYVRTALDGTKFYFSTSHGWVTSAVDPFGNTVTYEYDASARLVKIYDPVRTYAGSPTYIELRYGANGLSQILEPGASGAPDSGRVTHVSVDANRRLASITDPDSVATQFGYDANGLLQTVTDRRGGVTHYVYTPQTWKLARIELPAVALDDGAGGTTAATVPALTLRPWQSVGLPDRTTAGAPFTAWPADSTIGRVTDPAGRTTSFSVDALGEPLTTFDPLGNKTVVVRSGERPTEVHRFTAAGLESVDYFAYGNGNVPGPTSQQLAGEPKTDIVYGPFGKVQRVSGNGVPTQISYIDPATGRVDSVDVGAKRSKYAYDARGRVLSTVDPSGHTVTTAYESRFGNVDSTVVPGNRVAKVRYDGYGRDSMTSATGRPSDITVYDVMNRVVRHSDGVHASPATYTYTNDALTQLADPKGQQWGFTYNALGWKTSETRPGSANALTFRYDVAGRVTSTTNRRGQRIDVRYDSLGRVVAKFGSNADSVSFGYSRDGLVSTSAAFRAGSTQAHVRDSAFVSKEGWTDSVVTWLGGKRFRAKYAPTTRYELAGVTFDVQGSPGLTLTARSFGYDATYRYVNAVTVGGRTMQFAADTELLAKTVTYPVGTGTVTRTQSYTSLHQPYAATFSNATINTALGRTFGYDSLGRVTHEERSINSTSERARDYGYDGVGQLTSANYYTVSDCTVTQQKADAYGGACDAGTQSAQSSASYSYDDAGSLRQIVDTAGVTTASTFDGGNRLTKWGGDSLLYDADGNRSDKLSPAGNVHYDWTADGLLRSVTVGSATVTYDYDAHGQLVRKSRNGTVERHFLWDQGQLLAELDSAAAAKVAEYVYAIGRTDAPLAILVGTDTTLHFFEQDAADNVVGAFSGATGAVEQQIGYEPFGQVTGVSGSLTANRLQWKGLMWEADAGLYFVRARWYDPAMRRFVSEDPIGAAGGTNQYAFAENSPISRRDPSGLRVAADGPCTIYAATCGDALAFPTSHGGGGGGTNWSLPLRCEPTETGEICTPNGAPSYYDVSGEVIPMQRLPHDLAAPCRNFGEKCGQLRAVIDRLATLPGACGRLGRAALARFLIGNYWYVPDAYFNGHAEPGYAGFPGIVELSSRVFTSEWFLMQNVAHEEGHLYGFGYFDSSEESALDQQGYTCANEAGAS